jgi:predicted kinase
MSTTLHFFAGRTHSGKSTEAARLGRLLRAPVLSIDHWVNVVGPADGGIDDYMKTYPKCQKLMEELVIDLLRNGTTVIFDFGGNSRVDREWVRGILEASGAAHTCHVLDTSADVCRSRFHASTNKEKMAAEHFEMLLNRYDPPKPSDGFVLRSVGP